MAKKKTTNVVRLNMYLIKKNYKSPDEAIRASEQSSLERFSLNSKLDFKGLFVLKSTRSDTLKWIRQLMPIIDTEIDIAKVFSSYASAVLFLKVKSRIFAITFGGGKNLLLPGSFESDFGLKVALNTIDPQKLRSLDTHNLDDSGMQIRRQAGQNSGLEIFGLNVERDLLRSVTGVPTDLDFALRITGRESLLIQSRTDVRKIHSLCEKAINYYGQKTYRQHFEWLDQLQPISDPVLEGKLNSFLLRALNERSAEGLHLSFPEILSGEEQYEFRYPTGKRAKNPSFEDLNIEDFFSVMPKDFEFTPDHLKSLRIQARSIEADVYMDKWRLVDCLSYEVKEKRHSYVLNLGQWYAVKGSLVDDVSAYLTAHYISSHDLFPYKADETEGDYNQRVSVALNFVLFDQKTEKVPGASTPIEVCDLYDKNKRMYHVKRKMRSSTLSHLFAQGYVAGISLIDSKEFREHARKVLQQANENRSLIPSNNYKAGDFEIVYAIMVKKRGLIARQLPFFSQLTFRQYARELERVGYKVGILRVDRV